MCFLLLKNVLLVNARGGFSVNPHYGINDHPYIDELIVVGGIHTQGEFESHYALGRYQSPSTVLSRPHGD